MAPDRGGAPALALGATPWVRVALLASLLMMLAVEYLNTTIEKLCDHLHPDRHPRIGTVEHLASARGPSWRR